MADTTERSEVLQMIQAGKISAAEGVELLKAMHATPAARPAELDNRWLRVRVADLTSRRPQVNVNVPMTWVNAGLRIGRSFVPELDQIDWNRVLNSPPGSGPIRLLEVEDMDDNRCGKAYESRPRLSEEEVEKEIEKEYLFY